MGSGLVDRGPYGVHLLVHSAPDSALTDSCALFSLGPRRGGVMGTEGGGHR